MRTPLPNVPGLPHVQQRIGAVEKRLRSIDELGRIAPEIDATGIDSDADLREEFDIDSMDFLNLVTALSERLKIEIPETDYPSLATLRRARRIWSKS
jgi:acyl carrier protein